MTHASSHHKYSSAPVDSRTSAGKAGSHRHGCEESGLVQVLPFGSLATCTRFNFHNGLLREMQSVSDWQDLAWQMALESTTLQAACRAGICVCVEPPGGRRGHEVAKSRNRARNAFAVQSHAAWHRITPVRPFLDTIRLFFFPAGSPSLRFSAAGRRPANVSLLSAMVAG